MSSSSMYQPARQPSSIKVTTGDSSSTGQDRYTAVGRNGDGQSNAKIVVSGTIDKQSAEQFADALSCLAAADHHVVVVELRPSAGDIKAALYMVSSIRSSPMLVATYLPCSTHVVGLVVFAAGHVNHRYAMPETTVTLNLADFESWGEPNRESASKRIALHILDEASGKEEGYHRRLLNDSVSQSLDYTADNLIELRLATRIAKPNVRRRLVPEYSIEEHVPVYRGTPAVKNTAELGRVTDRTCLAFGHIPISTLEQWWSKFYMQQPAHASSGLTTPSSNNNNNVDVAPTTTSEDDSLGSIPETTLEQSSPPSTQDSGIAIMGGKNSPWSPIADSVCPWAAFREPVWNATRIEQQTRKVWRKEQKSPLAAAPAKPRHNGAEQVSPPQSSASRGQPKRHRNRRRSPKTKPAATSNPGSPVSSESVPTSPEERPMADVPTPDIVLYVPFSELYDSSDDNAAAKTEPALEDQGSNLEVKTKDQASSTAPTEDDGRSYFQDHDDLAQATEEEAFDIWHYVNQ